MSATRTQLSLVKDALRFYNEAEIWIGFGKTSAWNVTINGTTHDDTNPPPADGTAIGLTEAVAYKKVDEKHLVKPIADVTGLQASEYLTWRSQHYQIVSEQDAATAGAHWVYIKAAIDNNQAPVTFRQLGVFTGLTRAGDATLVAHADVTSVGTLELVANRKPVPHDTDTVETIAFVREF